MCLAILKITRMHTAQSDATIPIRATRLLPVRRLLKSRRVMLKIISPKAIAISVYIKIFIAVLE